MSFNRELAERVLAHIEEHPETWNQAVYRCETGMCFAGWAVELSGHGWYSGPSLRFTAHLTDVVGDHDRQLSVDELAMRELGIDDAQVFALFNADNTLDDIKRVVVELSEQ